ncbi:MAG: SAM-dependent methyltransferase, partial [Mycobacteriales bacterium]
MRTVREAWQEALYGPRGRFVASGVRDFSTPLTDPVTAPVLCAHLLSVAVGVDRALGEPAGFTVTDVGAGSGAFLAFTAGHCPPRWRLQAVEVGPRPRDLDRRIAWGTDIPETCGFLLAHEWLDDVPLDVVRAGRVVLADGSLGAEHDTAWIDRWGGEEDGSARDDAWRRATDRLTAGVALAVDYGHTRATRRPTLTGWRAGRPVPPAFDGSCDVTAHVALDSLAAAVPGQALTTQRDALAAVEPDGLATAS